MPSEIELSYHGAGKGNGCNVLLRRRARVSGLVNRLEHGVDRADDPVSFALVAILWVKICTVLPVEVAIGKETGAASNSRPASLPARLLGSIECDGM